MTLTGLVTIRGEQEFGIFEEDEDFSCSPRQSRLTPEPELAQSSSYKSRMSLNSARRLSVSLVEGLLDIPFKQKRKTSAPIVSPIDQETVDNMKLKFMNKKEVSNSEGGKDDVMRVLGPGPRVCSVCYCCTCTLHCTLYCTLTVPVHWCDVRWVSVLSAAVQCFATTTFSCLNHQPSSIFRRK